MAMIRDRLQKLTLIQKLVSMILAILFLVTSLLLVNAIVSVQIKRFVVSLVDDKVSALLDNTAISRQFDQIFAETHSFLTQFPRELETVAHAEAQFKTQMASIATDPEWMMETIEPQLAPFVRHTEDLFELAQGLAHHLVRLQGHLRANHDTIAQLDQAVLEHEFQLSAHSHDKADYIHQLAIIVPALFEIHHELRIHLLHIRHNFLGTAERLQQHREAAGKRLEEINLALRAIPPGSEDTRAIFTTAQGQIVAIAQEVVHLNAAIDQYRHLHDRTIHTKSLLLSRIDAINRSIADQSTNLAASVNTAVGKAIRTSSLLSLVIIALLFLVMGLTKRFTHPLKQLTAGVNRVGGGDLDFRVQVASRDEISHLAASFNQMTENLRNTMVSKAYMESILDNMNESLIVVNNRHEITEVNASTCRLLGYTAGEVVGRPIGMLFDQDAPRMGALEADVLGSDAADRLPGCHVETRLIGKRGGAIPVIMSQAKMPGNSHEADRIVCLAIDISERKRSEDAIAEEKERLNITLHSIGDGVICTDREGRVTLLNRIAETLTGYSQAEATGKPLASVFQIVNERTREPLENPVQKVVQTGLISGLANHTLLISASGAEYVIEDSAAPILSTGNEVIGVVLVFRDITDKRQIEAERLKTQKLESMAILAGGIAHDFNNYLTAIMGNLSLAKVDAPPGDPVIPWLEKMENASLQAKGLTQQLLTFSRGGEPVKKVVSLAETLQNTISFSLRGSNVVSNMEIDDNLPPVEVDEGQIGQVVHNLILNANQAMPDGGVIHVRLTAEALPGLNSLKLPAGDYLRLTIADQGCGIPREHVSKIFDPYFTTKSEGSGLGLTAAYAIIKKHQGSLSVTSTPGKGTRFHVHLPVSRGAEQRRVSVDPAIASGKGRVLLMDDEYFIRDMAQLMISKLGYHISVVENGHQACNVYQKSLDNGTPFDIVILDLTIPGGMGGRETLAQLKQIDPEVKAVVSSGYSNDPIMANFIEYGFVDIVTKPYSLEDMSRVLQRVTRLQSATCA